MGLFDKLLGKQEKIKASTKSLSKMTDDELRKLANDAFWKDEDMPLTEQCMRMRIEKGVSALFYAYVLGFVEHRSNLVKHCFTPDFDALERNLNLMYASERENYLKTKREWAQNGKGLPNIRCTEILILDEIQNLRRVGYDKIERTPENVFKFFYQLALKGDPTGQFWYAMCYEKRYHCLNLYKLGHNDGFAPAVEQDYLMAVVWSTEAQFEKQRSELKEVLDQYMETVAASYPLQPFSQFIAQAYPVHVQLLQDRARVHDEANTLYQQGLALFDAGEQEKAYDSMKRSDALGHRYAHEWVAKQDAEAGDARAQYQSSKLYLYGTMHTPQNVDKGVSLLEQAASNGIIEAYWRLGELYRNGIGLLKFETNAEKAKQMHCKAADGNYIPSMVIYGDYCEPAKAKALYLKAVLLWDQTDEYRDSIVEAYRKLSITDPADGETSILAAAQFVLMYFDSTKKLDYTHKTPEESVKAVFAGDADTACRIGTSVKHSANIADCEKVASVWWRLAADLCMEHAVHGDVEAIKQLYYIYIDHLKDDGKAYYWGMKGLETGDAAMYYEVANHPTLFTLDHEEIIAYLEIAAQKGYEAAKEDLIWWRNQERNELERQRKVQRILDEQEAQRRSQKEWELNTRLDDLERMSNALAYGEIFTDEERALMGKMSVMDSIRSANLRDEVMKLLMKKK